MGALPGTITGMLSHRTSYRQTKSRTTFVMTPMSTHSEQQSADFFCLHLPVQQVFVVVKSLSMDPRPILAGVDGETSDRASAMVLLPDKERSLYCAALLQFRYVLLNGSRKKPAVLDRMPPPDRRILQ